MTPLVALAFGGFIASLAVPQLMAGMFELPAQPVLEQLRKGITLGDRYLAIAVKGEAAALNAVDEGRGWAALALLRFTQARRAGLSTEEGRALLEQSVAADRRAVARSPAQVYAWTRLAHGELLRGGASPRVAPYLERAISLSPYDSGLLFSRLELSFLAWRHLDAALREQVADQVRFAAGLAPDRLARLTRKRYAITAVRDALAAMPKTRSLVDYYLRLY